MKQEEVVILYNPTACSGIASKKLPKIEYYLKKSGLKFKVYENIERDKVIEKYSSVLVIGGDGTLHDVVNSILKSKNKEIKLMYIPAGTGNNAAANFNIPFNIKKACKILISKETKKIDLGKIEGKYFITGLSLGFPAEVLEERNKHKVKLWKLSYFLPAPKVFFLRYKMNDLKIELDDKVINTKVFTLAIGKKKNMGLNLLQDAKINDGFLNIFVMENIPKNVLFFKGLYWFLFFKRFHFKKNPNVKFFKTKKVRISSNKSFLVEMDGELLGKRKKFDVEIVEKVINVVMP
jgi:YegS/Rv2252/BmrU family lipid kinase